MPSIFKHINSTILHPSLYNPFVNTEQAHVHSGKIPNPATTYKSHLTVWNLSALQ